MTPYAIFAIVLTIAYIIYYGYHISKDLYGKKGQAETTEEIFDVQAVTGDEVVATAVRETGDGFSVGESPTGTTESTQMEPATSPTLNATGDTPTDQTDKFSSMMQQMDETDVTSEGGIRYPELEQMLMEQNPVILFRKSTVKETREIL